MMETGGRRRRDLSLANRPIRSLVVTEGSSGRGRPPQSRSSSLDHVGLGQGLAQLMSMPQSGPGLSQLLTRRYRPYDRVSFALTWTDSALVASEFILQMLSHFLMLSSVELPKKMRRQTNYRCCFPIVVWLFDGYVFFNIATIDFFIFSCF
jgi:hypothetical protein